MIKGIKICGVSDLETLKFIINHPYPPKYVGFITNYEKSKRFVDYEKLKILLNVEKKNINFVSVMVKPSDEFLKEFEHTYFKEVFDVLSKKYKLGRVRLLLKEPRSTLSWHRDPEPRLHIPIYTNPGCLMVIDEKAKHMPADGSVWITNNTKYHNAFNGGEENRVHLVACVLDYKFN